MARLTDDTLKPFLLKRVDEYVSRNIAESLHRNRHMNEYQGQDVDLVEAKNLLTSLVDRIDYIPDMLAINVLDSMTASAKRLSVAVTRHDIVMDAVMVDFINAVGGFWCVDYALYTKDLTHE